MNVRQSRMWIPFFSGVLFFSLSEGFAAKKTELEASPIESIRSSVSVKKAGQDWLSYMGNESRTGVSSESVTVSSKPAWVFSMMPPIPGFKPTFQNEKGENAMGQQRGIPEPSSRFDFASPVLISGDKAYFGTSTEEILYCLNVNDGSICWSFKTEGSIRLSPTIVGKKIFFGSDDGFVYCLNKNNGSKVWTFKADPTDRHIVANGRLAAQCPVRTSVTHYNGILHFAAGMFPNGGGVHLYGVDLNTGKQRWKTEMLTMAQGYILAQDGVLFVPVGRTSPVEYEAATGKPITLKKVVPRMDSGGSTFIRELYDMIVFGPNEKGVMTVRVNKNQKPQKNFYDRRSVPTITGDKTVLEGVRLLADETSFYLLKDGTLTAIPNGSLIESLKQSAADFSNRRGRGGDAVIGGKGMFGTGDRIIAKQIESYKEWTAQVPTAVTIILAGDKLYAGGKDLIYIIDRKTGAVSTRPVIGTAWELSAGASSLFISTDAGKIYRFGTERNNRQIQSQTPSDVAVSPEIKRYAKEALAQADTDKGYCVVLGGTDGSLGIALAALTDMQIVYFVKTRQEADTLSQAFMNAGLYGNKITVRQLKGKTIPYISYFANLIVSENGFFNTLTGFSAKEVYRILQPNGGVLVLGGASASLGSQWKSAFPEIKTLNAVAVARRGDLKGAGNWTHLWGNPQNTSSSGDELVKGSTFDMQWFGYPYPSGHAAGWHFLSNGILYNKGVMLVLYTDYVIAVDAWNGTVLWEKDITGSLRYSQMREGGNGCMDDHNFYLTFNEECHVIDLTNGKTVKKLTLPNAGDWGFIAAYDRYLIGSSQDKSATINLETKDTARGFWYGKERTFVTSDSVTVKTKDGNNVWTYQNPKHSIINSTITIGDDKIFFVETALETGEHALPTIKEHSPKLVALHLADQSPVWTKQEVTLPLQNILYAAYSDGHLFLSGSTIGPNKKTDKASYHYQKINAKTGELVWSQENAATGRGASHNEITCNSIYLKDWIWIIPPSAKPTKISVSNGASTPLTARGRGKGCSMITGSKHIAIYRSNSIGFTNFDADETGYISQVNRPSCFIGQVPAGGMVLIPEGSVGCVCGFPYQGSLVLAPKRETEK